MKIVFIGKNSHPPSTDAATLALKQMKLGAMSLVVHDLLSKQHFTEESIL